MGIFGTALGRMAYGAAQISNKYIDEEMAQQRAQAFADIQFQSNKKLDEYNNNAARREAMRVEGAKDDEAKSAAALRSKVAEASSPELTRADIERKNAITRGTLDADVEATGKITAVRTANTGHDLKPGDQYFVGGTKVSENTRSTPAEIQRDLYENGLKTAGGGRGGASLDRMSEVGKLQLQGVEKRDQAIQAQIDKGVTEGTLSPNPTDRDGKPNPAHENFRFLQQQRLDLYVEKHRVLAAEGVISGTEDAQRLLEAGANSADLTKSVELAKRIGGKYGAEFVGVAAPILEKMKSPEYKAGVVKDAAAANGDVNYNVDIGGVKSQVRSPLMSVAAQRVSASREPAPENSPSGQFQARQAKLAADNAAKYDKAREAFSKLDIKDSFAAAELQGSTLFWYLSPDQKAAVHKAVMGR